MMRRKWEKSKFYILQGNSEIEQNKFNGFESGNFHQCLFNGVKCHSTIFIIFCLLVVTICDSNLEQLN